MVIFTYNGTIILFVVIMVLFVILSLFVFGLLFGSFSSVIIDRLKSGKKGIMTGRSECPHCKHLLSSIDLFPLFSWLFLLGKCRYCRAKISPIYPLLELSMGALFALGGYFFVDITALLHGSLVELARLGFILSISFVTVIFTFYDIRFTEIPDEILIPAIFLITILLGIDSFYSLPIFSYMIGFEGVSSLNIHLINGLTGAWIVYTFFYLQILIPGLIYTLGQKKYKLAGEVILGYVEFLWWVLKFPFSRNHDEEESSEEEDIPTWIGGGDLRIALFMGLILGIKLTLIALFLSYIIGSIISVGVLMKNRKRGQMIPFGPFLGAGLMITLLWNSAILDWIQRFLQSGL